MTHVEKANQYARDVVSGKILACKWVKLACKRHLDDLEHAKKGYIPYRFDEEKAKKACSFIEKLPHTKDRWAVGEPGKPGSNKIRLEPWQCFIVARIFGWLHVETGLRRFRKVYICVPRKNGKSTLSAGIGLYMTVADKEYGAEVYSGATSEKQALEVFKPAWLMVHKEPGMRAHFNLELSGTYKNPGTISSATTYSKFEPVIGKPGDGASPSCAIIDEYHEHQSDALLDTMYTGMGARQQPLLIAITTAGVDTAGPCYQLQLDAEKVLEGTMQDDELFAIIYGIDTDDDWTSEEALIKANPNYGVSVGSEFLISAQRQAVQSSRKQNAFKTKHLNIWCGARDPFFNLEAWNQLADKELSEDQFAGESCYGGMDLASKVDIASKLKIFTRIIDGVEHYYFFANHYLPEEAVNDPSKQHYQMWAYDGYLTVTDGNIIDQDTIKDDILHDAKLHRVEEWGYDPYGATKLALELQAEGVNMVEIPQTTRNLSEPMKWMDALIISGRAHHNGDPVLAWMIANVTAKIDRNENVFPCKERPENKIDGVVAALMALGRAMAHQDTTSIYTEEGMLFL
jgi:phage terminase large subunit-like protein